MHKLIGSTDLSTRPELYYPTHVLFTWRSELQVEIGYIGQVAVVSTDVRSFWCRGPLGKNENDGDLMVPVAENKRKKNKVGGWGEREKKWQY